MLEQLVSCQASIIVEYVVVGTVVIDSCVVSPVGETLVDIVVCCDIVVRCSTVDGRCSNRRGNVDCCCNCRVVVDRVESIGQTIANRGSNCLDVCGICIVEYHSVDRSRRNRRDCHPFRRIDVDVVCCWVVAQRMLDVSLEGVLVYRLGVLVVGAWCRCLFVDHRRSCRGWF